MRKVPTRKYDNKWNKSENCLRYEREGKMKIRNTKKNIDIIAPHIYLWSYKGEDVFIDEDCDEFFYLKDGWEEVKEESQCTIVSLINYLEGKRDKLLPSDEFAKIDKAWRSNDWKTIINYIKKFDNEDKER